MYSASVSSPLVNLRVLEALRRWFGRRPEASFLARNHAFFSSFDHSRPLDECEFVVMDTELTGLNARQDEIVSIGAVRVRGMSISPGDVFYEVVRPRMELPKNSTLVHYITPEAVKGRPRLEEVLPGFVEFCGGALVVGHLVGMDMSFVNRALKRHFGAGMRTPCIDTMRLAQVYQEEQWESYHDRYSLDVSYNLTDLSKRFGLPLFAQHNALNDALQAAYLFLFLVKKLRKGGIESLKDLYMSGRSWRWYF